MKFLQVVTMIILIFIGGMAFGGVLNPKGIPLGTIHFRVLLFLLSVGFLHIGSSISANKRKEK